MSSLDDLARLIDDQVNNWRWDSVAAGMSVGDYVAPMILAAGYRQRPESSDAELLESWRRGALDAADALLSWSPDAEGEADLIRRVVAKTYGRRSGSPS